MTKELHGSIHVELDDVDRDVDDLLEYGVCHRVEKFGDDGVGGLVPNDPPANSELHPVGM
jgi:hypothetical protein